MMRFGIPTLPPPARRARRRDPADPRPRRDARAGHARSTDIDAAMARRAASTRRSSPSARTSASAPTSRPARPRRSSTPSRCCAAWRARSRRCSGGASSSTAAATPRSTPRARPSASAPRRRSSSTAARATGCRRTTSRSRRREEEGVLMQWLSTIKQADEGKLVARADGARRDRLPAADRRDRGARGRLASSSRSARRPTSRCSTASPGIEVEDGVVQVGAGHDDRAPRDLRGRRHGARRAHRHRRHRPRQAGRALHRRAGCAASRSCTRRARELATFDELNTWYYADAPRTVRAAARRWRGARSTFDEVAAGLDEDNALFEARRCLSCGNCFGCDNCYGVCPDNAVLKLDERPTAYAFDLDYCKGCGICVAGVPVRRDRDDARGGLKLHAPSARRWTGRVCASVAPMRRLICAAVLLALSPTALPAPAGAAKRKTPVRAKRASLKAFASCSSLVAYGRRYAVRPGARERRARRARSRGPGAARARRSAAPSTGEREAIAPTAAPAPAAARRRGGLVLRHERPGAGRRRAGRREDRRAPRLRPRRAEAARLRRHAPTRRSCSAR